MKRAPTQFELFERLFVTPEVQPTLYLRLTRWNREIVMDWLEHGPRLSRIDIRCNCELDTDIAFDKAKQWREIVRRRGLDYKCAVEGKTLTLWKL
jgi:hypothetical protein